jgi:hypothetical protein
VGEVLIWINDFSYELIMAKTTRGTPSMQFDEYRF